MQALKCHTMLGKPDLTPKAKGDQQADLTPLTLNPRLRSLHSRSGHTHTPTCKDLSKRGELGQKQGTDVGLCSCSRQKAASRCFSLLSTSCQYPTPGQLQRSLLEIKSHMPYAQLSKFFPPDSAMHRRNAHPHKGNCPTIQLNNHLMSTHYMPCTAR